MEFWVGGCGTIGRSLPNKRATRFGLSRGGADAIWREHATGPETVESDPMPRSKRGSINPGNPRFSAGENETWASRTHRRCRIRRVESAAVAAAGPPHDMAGAGDVAVARKAVPGAAPTRLRAASCLDYWQGQPHNCPQQAVLSGIAASASSSRYRGQPDQRRSVEARPLQTFGAAAPLIVQVGR